MTTTTTASPATAARTSEPTRWTLDSSHSSVGFSVRHMMITNVRGEFSAFEGEARFDPRDPARSSIVARIDVSSISTREDKRDAHLKSADFFDAEGFPTMTFTSRAVRAKGDGYEVLGDLTVRGTTREVTLRVDDVTPEHVDPWGNRRIGASAKTTIKRSDFGMTWNSALEAGGVLVGDDVKIQIDVSLVAAG